MNTVLATPATLVYHELRSPLALVATMAQSAAADCEDELLRSRCLSIVRAAERMLRTASHLIQASSAEATAAEGPFDPIALLHSLAEDYRNLGVPVHLYVSFEGEVCLRGAPENFETLICSIIGNATDHGDPDRPIVVSLSRCQGGLEVAITNSVGTKRHAGLGLGSYIAEQLAAQLGGSVSVSQDGDSYTRCLRVPTADLHAVRLQNLDESLSLASARSDLGSY